jgi:hypothetical protein
MREREHYALATVSAEAMYNLWELENKQAALDLDEMMRRLKDLSNYSLTHAKIMDQCEGVELLALAMFFGTTSDRRFHKNQERLQRLSPETIAYKGQTSIVEEDVARRRERRSPSDGGSTTKPSQPRLL